MAISGSLSLHSYSSPVYFSGIYESIYCVAWWSNGYGVRLAIERSRVQLLAFNQSVQVVHTRVCVTENCEFKFYTKGTIIWALIAKQYLQI